MCNMHHKMIDKIEPDRHPADRLEGWKRDREADGLGASSDIAV
jgi:hypothetical protein